MYRILSVAHKSNPFFISDDEVECYDYGFGYITPIGISVSDGSRAYLPIEMNWHSPAVAELASCDVVSHRLCLTAISKMIVSPFIHFIWQWYDEAFSVFYNGVPVIFSDIRVFFPRFFGMLCDEINSQSTSDDGHRCFISVLSHVVTFS